MCEKSTSLQHANAFKKPNQQVLNQPKNIIESVSKSK